MAKKYIDADKLIATLERQNVDKKVVAPLIRIIDSLQQEQPEMDLERDAVQFCFDKGLNVTPYQAKTIASHFYELGRKQVLQEIYDGKTKPVDKITAAWLDD